MSLLLLFANAPTGAQTWTGSAGTVTITGSSGSWTAGATWTGSAGSVIIVGLSQGFAGATTSIGAPHGGDYHPITFGPLREQDDQLALILALI